MYQGNTLNTWFYEQNNAEYTSKHSSCLMQRQRDSSWRRLGEVQLFILVNVVQINEDHVLHVCQPAYSNAYLSESRHKKKEKKKKQT